MRETCKIHLEKKRDTIPTAIFKRTISYVSMLQRVLRVTLVQPIHQRLKLIRLAVQ